MSIMLFIAMALLSLFITLLSDPPFEFLSISVSFVRYLILLSNIIPVINYILLIDIHES